MLCLFKESKESKERKLSGAPVQVSLRHNTLLKLPSQALCVHQRTPYELLVLEAYLPQRLGADEVATEVAKIVGELGAELGRNAGPGDMGKVMGAVKARLAGKADMGLVSAAVKKALAP